MASGFRGAFPGGECPLVAEIDPDSIRDLAQESGKDGGRGRGIARSGRGSSE